METFLSESAVCYETYDIVITWFINFRDILIRIRAIYIMFLWATNASLTYNLMYFIKERNSIEIQHSQARVLVDRLRTGWTADLEALHCVALRERPHGALLSRDF